MTTELLVYAISLVVMWLVAMRLRSASARQWLYLAASLLFYYSWAGWLIVFLLFSSLMNYGLGQWLKKNITSQRLWTAVGINLVFLGVFKYLPALGAAAPAGSTLAILRRMVFPIGISFWTFQALSYLFELYREEDLDPTPVEFFADIAKKVTRSSLLSSLAYLFASQASHLNNEKLIKKVKGDLLIVGGQFDETMLSHHQVALELAVSQSGQSAKLTSLRLPIGHMNGLGTVWFAPSRCPEVDQFYRSEK